MKIQYIHNEYGNIIGTLAAVKDEAKGVVNLGYSSVKDGDNTGKKSRNKIGRAIAGSRALQGGVRQVPNKIKEPFIEFVTHCQNRNEFNGFHLPVVEDFEFVLPFKQRDKTQVSA